MSDLYPKHDAAALLDDLIKHNQRLCEILRLATQFVEDREEATDSIWYCNGDKGRALLEAIGIPYVEKS